MLLHGVSFSEFAERSTPAKRNKLKLTLMTKQQGKCAELDRKNAIAGYTEENCRLIHHQCHRDAQAAQSYR
jgi:hypothetical protein